MTKHAHDGTELKAGQLWLSSDGEFKSLIVGFNFEGLPVIEQLDGWPGDGYTDIEKFWKSMFLHSMIKVYDR